MAKKYNAISLGKINKRIFIILLGGVVYIGLLFVEQESMIFEEEQNKHPIVYALMNSLSLCLSFILIIIYYYKNKRTNVQVKLSLLESQLAERESINTTKQIKPTSKAEKFLWILLVSVIDFFCLIFSSIFWVTSDSYLSTLQLNIIPMAIFSYFILKMKLFRHHYLCIFVVVLKSIVCAIIFQTFNNISDFTKEILPLIVTFITDIISCLIESILSIITLVIIWTKFKHVDDFSDFKEKADGKQILILISWMIINPFYLYFSIILSEYIVFFVGIEALTIGQIICTIIFMLFCSFMILVFVEIIELNFFAVYLKILRKILN